jgi:predicted TIM-barrel fold metal-dependent hydrolase
MQKNLNCPIVALEEHYLDAELAAHFAGDDRAPGGDMARRLADLGEQRLREMDEAGIDIQVLSHAAPATQKLAADMAVGLARRVNDRLAAAVRAHPRRFAAFAALPTSDPAAAADELSRAVEELGFKGAMLHGMANDTFLDHRRFWPIYARAERLDVPVYLHPSVPHPSVVDAYLRDYAADFPVLLRAAWGFTIDTATLAIRLALSGVFEAHPRLQFVLGHFGETLPFLLRRIDQALARPGQKSVRFRELFCRHFHVTTSGNFSDPALLCTMMEMGADRILFSVDWPYVANGPGVQWLERAPIAEADKVKIFSGNALRLLKL